MEKIKVIKNEMDYQEALKLADNLVCKDPDPNSDEGEQLAILCTLVQDYERKTFPDTIPDPIDAIKFRMEQVGLKQIDLVPYIGSRSRVSEILSGKRQLTLDMIRALEIGLGIPSKALIKKHDLDMFPDYALWDIRLVKEMEKRNYFDEYPGKKRTKTELLESFFESITFPPPHFSMCRQSYRSSPLTDKHALTAWASYVLKKANNIEKPIRYKHGSLDICFLHELIKLSSLEDGPILAQDALLKKGIVLVIEPHFPKTYLDGATFLIDKDNPVIGLTLRYDRLDNFWFTLLHELAHVSLHSDLGISLFYDEIEGIKNIDDIDIKEKEADTYAEEIILPNAVWVTSPARIVPSSLAATSLSKELGINIAVIAGQIRHRTKNYGYLSRIVNESTVRRLFVEVKWNK